MEDEDARVDERSAQMARRPGAGSRFDPYLEAMGIDRLGVDQLKVFPDMVRGYIREGERAEETEEGRQARGRAMRTRITLVGAAISFAMLVVTVLGVVIGTRLAPTPAPIVVPVTSISAAPSPTGTR